LLRVRREASASALRRGGCAMGIAVVCEPGTGRSASLLLAAAGPGRRSPTHRTAEKGGKVEALRVLIAEDHPVFRDGLRALLATVPGTEVVGEARTGTDAVEQSVALQPDVVVMDLDLPELDGVGATRQIVAMSPHVGVLVLTMFDDDESVFAAMRAGARGFLLKGADQEEIRRAIVAVSRGEAIFGPGVAHRLMEFFAAPRPAALRAAFPGLTEREREVVELIAKGDSNAAIAMRLGISAKTVRNHVSNIFTKLQVTDRAHAIIRARDAGLGAREGDA
jgi:DNA-binding NarL/FixJ family response regulator